MGISEINSGHLGSNQQAHGVMQRALKMQEKLDDCTIKAGWCIQ
jgi:hypothetical protein